jgi:hypothetical protein
LAVVVCGKVSVEAAFAQMDVNHHLGELRLRTKRAPRGRRASR